MALKFVSSLEKCFLSDNIADKATFSNGSFLKNERFHLGVCFTADDPDAAKRAVTLRVVSPLAAYVAVRKVVHVPVRMACNPGETVADDYITTEPGLYPDMLVPLAEDGQLFLQKNLESLFSCGASVWIRIPVIGGVNDTEEDMRAIREFLSPYRPEKIELLPYHRLGEPKYAALGLPIPQFPEIPEGKMKALRAVFS